MSCADCSPNSYHDACRREVPYPSVSAESVPSLFDNLVYALYGTITKSVVNGRVVWNIPCDPNLTEQIVDLPRLTGEGLLCYTIRALDYVLQVGAPVTLGGTQTLTNKTLTSPTINNPILTGTIAASLFSGPLTGNVTGNLTGNVVGNVTGNLTGTASQATTAATAATAATATNSTSSVNVTGAIQGTALSQLIAYAIIF